MLKTQTSPSRPNVALLVLPWGAYGAGLYRGFQRFASEHPDWMFHPIGVLDKSLASRLGKVLRSRHIDGAIVALFDEHMRGPVSRLKIPVVNVLSTYDLSIPTVCTDSVATGKIVAQYYLDRKYRSYAFFGDFTKFFTRQRYEGFSSLLQEHGFACPWHSLVINDYVLADFSPSTLYKWLRSLPKPLAVMAGTDHHSRELLLACQQLGFRVPQDVALVGVDDDTICSVSTPKLSSVTVNFGQQGYEACRMLHGQLAGRTRGPGRVLIPPGQLIERESSDTIGIQDPYVAQAIRLIRERAHEQIDLPEVLRTIPICRSNLDRRFRRTLGRTPYDHLWLERVERAKKLMVQTDMKLNEVSERSGFRTYNIFFLMFRRIEGCSPREYRQRFPGPREA